MSYKIAFAGKMGSGKDTCADHLISKIGGEKVAFARPIYQIMEFAQKTCNLPLEKDRKFLQIVGTEWGRSKDKNLWINLLLKKTREKKNYFLTDLRFENEVDILKANGWLIVKIDTCGNIFCDINQRAGSGTNLHSSETSLDSIPIEKYDHIIYNSSTFEYLYTQLKIFT